MSAGLALNEPLGSVAPDNGPLTSLPSTLPERVAATSAATFTEDRYFNIQAARKDRAAKIIDDYHSLTGERLSNPFDLVPTQEELFKDGVAQPIPTIMAGRLATLKDKTRLLRDQLRDQADQDPNFLNADTIDTGIAQSSEAARRQAGELVDTGNGVGNFVAGMALETATPHGVASLFAPVTRLPTAFAARTLETFAAQVGKEGLLQAGVGAGTQAVAEGFDRLSQGEVGTAKPTRDIVENILAAGAGGFLLGGGIRAAHLGLLSGAPLAVRDAARVMEYGDLYADTNRLGIEPALHERLVDQAQGDVLRGRSPNLETLLDQATTPMTGLSTILREAPDQMAIRLPGALDRIKALPDSEIEAVARQTKPQVFAPLDRIEKELSDVRSQLQGRQQEAGVITAADLVDPLTGARLQDIEDRLAAPALRAAERTQLEREREMILSSVDQKGELPKKLEEARAALETPEEAAGRQELEQRAAALEQQHAVARKEVENEVAALRQRLDQAGVGALKAFGDEIAPHAETGVIPPEHIAALDQQLRMADFERTVRAAEPMAEPTAMRTGEGEYGPAVETAPTMPPVEAREVAPETITPEMARAVDTEFNRTIEARPSLRDLWNDLKPEVDRLFKEAKAAAACAMGGIL